MKGWPKNFARIWLWVRRFLIAMSIMVATVTILVVIAVVTLEWRSCDTFGRTTVWNQGDIEAIIEEKVCGIIGGWCSVTVKLHKKKGFGFDTVVFDYSPAYSSPSLGKPWTHEPFVAWLDANELEIAVDRVSSVGTQLKEARGVKIRYHIGSVECP